MGLLTYIGQNFSEDNVSMICRIKLLDQLTVTAPNKSLHNLIETLKTDRPRHFYLSHKLVEISLTS